MPPRSDTRSRCIVSVSGSITQEAAVGGEADVTGRDIGDDVLCRCFVGLGVDEAEPPSGDRRDPSCPSGLMVIC